MMIKQINNADIVKEFFLDDPKLAYLSLPDGALVDLANNKYAVNSNERLIGLYLDNKLIAVGRYESFTDCAVTYHLYINSALHGTSVLDEINKIAHEYLKELNYKTAIVFTPSSCVHVHKAAEKRGYVLVGNIPSSQIWRQQLVDTLIYSKDL